MTVTTTVTISHEEMHKLKLKDEQFRSMGYRLRETTTWGKTFEKISWDATFEVGND